MKKKKKKKHTLKEQRSKDLSLKKGKSHRYFTNQIPFKENERRESSNCCKKV